GEDVSEELHTLVDRELSRLPDKYRAPLVLCELEGQTRKEAARRLGWPEGTVATRLTRARSLLAKRLARQGVGLPAALVTLGFSQGTAAATVPAPLVVATVKAASLFAAGHASAATASAAALAQGVLTSMLMTKLKIATALLVAVGVLGLLIGA